MNILLFGGSGEIGGKVLEKLLNNPICTSVTLLLRRELQHFQDHPKVKQVILDTQSVDFPILVEKIATGHDVGISCIGIGSGTLRMSAEEIRAVEVDLVVSFATGCKRAGVEIFELLTAVGSDPSQANSKIKAVRALGLKHKMVVDLRFEKLAIFQPGMIVGNRHTPHWLTFFTRLIPDSMGWGNVHIEELADAFIAHLVKRSKVQTQPVVCYSNLEMKRLIRE